MAPNNVLTEIRRGLERHIGKRITVRTSMGRKRVWEEEGVLEGTYPNIFVVRVCTRSQTRRISYSYSDVLTRTVRLAISGEKGELRVVDLGRCTNN
ncbi:MAG: Veg family protein [Anaerolineae bacterium]